MNYPYFDYQKVISIVDIIRNIFYPGLFEDNINNNNINNKTIKITKLKESLFYSFNIAEKLTHQKLDYNLINDFILKLEEIKETFDNDIKTIKDGDPSANSEIEIILAYPSAFAILIYRISHILYEYNIPIIPRILSEYAHEKTGIDINSGAKIGKNFFIDHGTGIVIGETTIIGDNVKIYQGVTLGALSLKKGSKLKNIKRHPTIKNNVTIYAGASILGGDTVIGNNVTIGSNVFIKESINDWETIYLGEQNLYSKK